MKKNWLFYLVVFALAAGLSGCDRLQAPAAPTETPVVPIVTSGGAVVVEGSVVPRDSARIYTRTGGKVIEVLVSKGDVVAEGDLLVRLSALEASDEAQVRANLAAAELERLNAQQALDDLEKNAALAAAQALRELNEATQALIEAQQELDDFDNDQYTTDLDNAKTDVTKAQDDLEDAQDEWDKYKDLDEDNTNRKNAKTKLEDAQKKYDDAVRKRDRLINDLDQRKAAVEAAQARKDKAQRDYDQRKGGVVDPDDLALAQARLANAEAQIAAANAALNGNELRAPFTGTVVELDAIPGKVLLAGQQALLLADLSELYVETTDLTEMDVVRVKEGDAAVITPDALEDLQLPAEVVEIARNAGKKGGDVTYTVRLKLKESDERLRWGMTVEVRFAEE